MTDYRLRMTEDERSDLWKFCPICGLSIEPRPDLEGNLDDDEAHVYGCSARAFHLLIWTLKEDNGESAEFI